jgi:hypothetical protein
MLLEPKGGCTMDFKKVIKFISALVAIAGLLAAVYVAISKLTAKKEPEYFDDNDFFECDNDIEIIDAKQEDTVVEDAPVEEEPAEKKAPAKKPAKKKPANKKADK